ncbi:MAG: trehalose-phosphatase [Acidimicrobiia bacterium]
MAEFGSITESLGVRPGIFCDYDGTLTEIVDDPAAALLSAATRSALHRLAACCPLGIVSGRRLSELKELVGVPGIMYVGSHGLEIVTPDGELFEPEEAKQVLPDLERAKADLAVALAELPGIVLERKPFSLVVHTRRAKSSEARRRATAAADAYVAGNSRLMIQRGKEVSELRPALDWDKGSAVGFLVGNLAGTTGSQVLYIGDDLTDESAFRWVRSQGGVAIVVGTSGRTAAHYQLADPAETASFLARLADSVY